MNRQKLRSRAAILAVCFSFGLGSGKAEVQFSGELRLRPEFFNNADFNKATQDTQSFIGSRLRVTGSGLAGEDIAVKVTFQDSRNWGEAATSSPIGLTDSGE